MRCPCGLQGVRALSMRMRASQTWDDAAREAGPVEALPCFGFNADWQSVWKPEWPDFGSESELSKYFHERFDLRGLCWNSSKRKRDCRVREPLQSLAQMCVHERFSPP